MKILLVKTDFIVLATIIKLKSLSKTIRELKWN